MWFVKIRVGFDLCSNINQSFHPEETSVHSVFYEIRKFSHTLYCGSLWEILFLIINKNAFQKDAYRPQQYPSAGGGSVCFSACWDTHPPGVGLGTPLSVGLEAPGQTPQHPPWMWAWRPPSHTPQHPPWVWAWRPPSHTPQHPPWVWAWRPLLWTEWLTDRCKNITFANFICGRQ